MKKKGAAPKPWTLEIMTLPRSPFVGESRRHKTRFEGCLRHADDPYCIIYGHTREEVITKARDHKLQYLAWHEAESNMERIEI